MVPFIGTDDNRVTPAPLARVIPLVLATGQAILKADLSALTIT